MNGFGAALARRHRWITIGALVLLTSLAWTWLIAGAGMNMTAQLEFALFPHLDPGGSMAMDWDLARIALTVSMWWVMMIAMMIPAAAPTILLYAHASRARANSSPPATDSFLAGYLVVWLAFSLLAAVLQMSIERSGLLTSMRMTVSNGWLAGGILIAAGLYQFSPAKDRCLAHCRNPASFLSRHYRPGAAGAFRLGVIHGGYCVGCCWGLMALLFVGGIMNLAWIAALTLLVAAEKLLPQGRAIAIGGGILLLLWGLATFFV